jgi:transcriptional regulator with XRE-family HTH domain
VTDTKPLFFSLANFQGYARKMLERETRGNGDQINAMERVAARCRMTPRSLRRFLAGETKNPGIRVFANIHAAYLEHLDETISQLIEERSTELARIPPAGDADFPEQIDAIRARLEAIKAERNSK